MPGGAPGKLEIAKLDCGSLEHLMKILDSWGGDFLLAAKRFANKIGGNLSTKRHRPNELLSDHPVFCGVFLYSAQTLIRNCALRWEAETGVKQAAAHIYNACTASGQLSNCSRLARRSGALPNQAWLERRGLGSCALPTHRELPFVYNWALPFST